ncbi:COPII coat assembly protein sec16-like [Triticum urartu]|uniref:COPII coat assembly protein sec16-like n=1 Tax=Triticum urartu TaxID=4572 RepID=UPI002044187F|nr:COPII coat assembly protein sec16-like [Triticum urartu]
MSSPPIPPRPPPLPHASPTTTATDSSTTAAASTGTTASLSAPLSSAPGTTPGQGQPQLPIQQPSPQLPIQQPSPPPSPPPPPYGPPPPLHQTAATGQQALAALTGGYPALPAPAASTTPWPQWPTPFTAPTAPSASTQGPQWPTWTPPSAPPSTVPSLPAATARAPPPPPPNPGPGGSSPSGLPIQEVRFPSSPSLLPDWLHGPPSAPTEARPPSGSPWQPEASGVSGQYVGPSTLDRAPSSALRTAEAVAPGAPHQQPPWFAKIDFATYDGSEDPLNWLNQCDQFFRGQRTPASERTWLASYHLRGAAQTWYYALKQDEGGMPPWDRFRELCLLWFGPPVRGSRLAELGRLSFTSTVQDFADRFQALECHAPGVTALQRAELFVGGLPDHIRVDVEMKGPQDLQTAMYYARAFEQRAQALTSPRPSAPRGGRQPPRPPPAAPASSTTAPAATPAPTRPFRRLTQAEQLERRRLGLCFNCDAPYAPGHVCPHLFYLETTDEIEDDTPEADLGAPTLAEPAAAPAPGPTTAFVVSLHALAGICDERTMLLPVIIHGERLVALLDTGSTHNFLP